MIVVGFVELNSSVSIVFIVNKLKFKLKFLKQNFISKCKQTIFKHSILIQSHIGSSNLNTNSANCQLSDHSFQHIRFLLPSHFPPHLCQNHHCQSLIIMELKFGYCISFITLFSMRQWWKNNFSHFLILKITILPPKRILWCKININTTCMYALNKHSLNLAINNEMIT
jgi:hypothetical protein